MAPAPTATPDVTIQNSAQQLSSAASHISCPPLYPTAPTMRHAIQHEESQVLHFTGQQMLPGPLTGSGCCAIASGRGSRAASSAATAPAYTAAAAGKGPATTAASRSSHAAPVAAAPAAASSGLASTATATDRNSAAPGTATASSGSWIQGQAGTSKACEDSLDERGG